MKLSACILVINYPMSRVLAFILLLIPTLLYAGEENNLVGWEHRFSENEIGKGLNIAFRLTVGTHRSYAAEFYLNPFYRWQKKYESSIWPNYKEYKPYAYLPLRYIDEIELYAGELLSKIKLHPRVISYSYDLPYVPQELKAVIKTNDNRVTDSSVRFPENLRPLPSSEVSPRDIDYRKPTLVADNQQFIFLASSSTFAGNNISGATLIYQCHPSLEQGAIKTLKITMGKHALFSPAQDVVLTETELSQAVYRMLLINEINLTRDFSDYAKIEKVTFVASCTTVLGHRYTKRKNITIKSIYRGS